MQNYYKWDLPSEFCGYNEIWSWSAGPQPGARYLQKSCNQRRF